MKIKEVRFNNFKAYRNPAPIKFSSDKEKNVTLIYGVMGAGKTSFFEAINWALYGKKVEGKNNTISDMGKIAGKYLKKELFEGNEAEVKVEIDFEHDGHDYYLTRCAYFKKNNGNLSYLRERDYVRLYSVTSDSQSRIYDSKEGDEETIFNIISNILPFSSREYFLFDGEKLDNFSKLDESDDIKKAIRQVLGLMDIENSKTNLNKVLDSLNKDYRKSEKNNEEVQQYTDALEIAKTEKEKETEKKEKLEESLSELSERFKENEEILLSFKDQLEKLEQRRSWELEKESFIDKSKKYRKNLRDLLTTAYNPYSLKTIEDAINMMDKWQKEGKFPAKYYNVDFIEKILVEKKCFFWEFEENSPEYKFFVEEINRLKMWCHDTQKELTDLFADLKELRQSSKSQYTNIKIEHSNFVGAQEEIEDLDILLEKINKELKTNLNDDKRIECEQRRTFLKTQIDQLKTKILIQSSIISQKQRDIDTFQKHISKITAKTDEGKKIQKKREIIINSINYLEKLHEYYSQKKRIEVESLTRDLFKSIFWKKAHFDDVMLTPEYKLFVSDKWDSEGKDTFSAGEREVLSLCFVSALAKSASKDAPFIIDTPFARISNEPTDNIASNLPQHLNQLILFVTDKELTDKAENIFMDKCEYIWTIKFNQNTSEADFMEGKNVKSKRDN